jgi:hypothetical protein
MKNLSRNLLNCGIGLVLAATTASAFADAPDYVEITNIVYAGSGCPAGSVAENLSPDRQAFTLLFDNYIAEVGPGVSAREKRKNCQINVSLDFPQGWTFAIADVDYRGYASLDRGVTGVQQASYYFQGEGKTGTLQTIMRGPLDKDFQIRDTLALTALVWAPCGAKRSLNINSQVRLDSNSRHAVGLLTTDSIDGSVKTIYNLKWKRCR